MELADFGAAGAAPPGDQQRAPLEGAFEGPDAVHDRAELVSWDEPGDAFDDAGHVGVRDQGARGDVVPFGDGGVAEEHGDGGDDAGAVRPAQWLEGAFGQETLKDGVEWGLPLSRVGGTLSSRVGGRAVMSAWNNARPVG
ncbi:hypothetical protein [Streptomyces sp. NPDC059743]|uniref:hypothetical protein n=1 Tax=Streptomyces sp. NPDC059743 TaxID=3346928 RepID=UPI003660DD6A